MMKQVAAALLAVTAGCATAETEGAFHINGRLEGASNVTHVVASNPANAQRVVAHVLADGSFDVALDPGSEWVVTFADWTKVGKDMQVATLQANSLDAFVPQGAGSLDLGTVKVADARAHGTTDWNEVIAALGIDEATATRMGKSDNLALRYANPDIDNDGTLDALQFGHNYKLDIAGAFTLKTAGRNATITDLVAGTYEDASLSYTGTTLQASVPRAMGMDMKSGTLTFEQAFYGLGGMPKVAAGNPVGAPHVKFGELDGAPLIGVVSRAGQDAPSGAYEIGFDNGQLTFSDVHVPSAASLEGAADYAVPFVHLRATDPRCQAGCDLSAIDIDWRSATKHGWQSNDSHAARIDLVVSVNGRKTTLSANLPAGKSSLAWIDLPIANTGILRSELAYIQSSEICYVQVSYASSLGMKMTMSVSNPACY